MSEGILVAIAIMYVYYLFCFVDDNTVAMWILLKNCHLHQIWFKIGISFAVHINLLFNLSQVRYKHSKHEYLDYFTLFFHSFCICFYLMD